MKKHILIISQYFYPEQFRINDIAQSWVESGHKVTVLTGIPNYPQGKFYDGYGLTKKRKECWNGVDIIRIPIFERGNSSIGMVLNYLSFVVSGFFWKCFTKLNADMVFTFEVSPMTQALVGVWYAKRRKIPNYIYVQDLWPENVEMATGIHSRFVINPISKMVNYIYRNCDKIFATSPSFVEVIRERVTDNKEKVIYWPQYAEEFYKPVDEKSELIPFDGNLNITFTGNIGTAQGLEVLPETAKILKSRGIFVRFNIVGGGRNKNNLMAAIENAGVKEYFNMIDYQRATVIPSILAASDAAFLSFEDNDIYAKTIPAKMQSYMACGCLIIGAVKGESERIINEAACGLVAKIGDGKSLANVIEELLEKTDEEKAAMRNASLDYCRNNFDKEYLMQLMDNEYLGL